MKRYALERSQTNERVALVTLWQGVDLRHCAVVTEMTPQAACILTSVFLEQSIRRRVIALEARALS